MNTSHLIRPYSSSSSPPPSPSPPSSPKLTHVTPSGEAHMVDVSPKPPTRRVAIAHAYVALSSPATLELIASNSAQKGDVLGVARVAGVMAAKRTSDWIPLCHPLALSKVEVDLRLVEAGVEGAMWTGLTTDTGEERAGGGGEEGRGGRREEGRGGGGERGHHSFVNAHGLVAIRALVACVGPTGVEMEALTAVTAAGLTVYDMVKAVDRAAVLGGARVVYKCGGKSGIHVDEGWAREVGRGFFGERGLEVGEGVFEEEGV